MAVRNNGYAFSNITEVLELKEASGLATGFTTICAIPASGKKLHIYYLSYQPLDISAELYYSFSLTERAILRFKPAVGGIVAKDFGDSRYIAGLVDEELILNNIPPSATQVLWNVFYTEVYP